MLLFTLDDKDKISNYCVMNGISTDMGGSQVNKFQQIPSDGHKMSLAGGWGQWSPCLRYRGQGQGGLHV